MGALYYWSMVETSPQKKTRSRKTVPAELITSA